MEPRPAFWAGKRVCVTGAGFLGFHLVRQLQALGAAVRLFTLPLRPDHPLRQDRDVEAVYGDVLDPHAVARGLAGSEVVIHTAGLVAGWGPALAKMRAVHVEGTANVLSAAGTACVIHVSSIVAVGAARSGKVLTENHLFNLDRLAVDYVHAKRAAEQVAIAAGRCGRSVLVVNPAYLVGPEDHEDSIMGRFCARFWKGRVPLAPPGGFNFVDVRDAARGCLLAAEHGRPGRRYILGGENQTLQSFLALLARAAGFQPRALPRLPLWMLGALAYVTEAKAAASKKEPYPVMQHVRMNGYFWFCRSDRARSELGYTSRPLSETLTDTYHWWRDAGLPSPRGLIAWWLRAGRWSGRLSAGGRLPGPEQISLPGEAEAVLHADEPGCRELS